MGAARVRRRGVHAIAAILAAIALLLVVWIGVAATVYPPEYVRRVLLWRDSDVGDYLHNFPHRPLQAATEPFQFDVATGDDRVSAVLESAFAVDDIDTFLTRTDTQAFIVIQDDRVVFERYYNGWQRDSMLTSFSVAKSFVSTLVLMAIEEGYVNSIDDPITDYLPEMAERDERFERVTIRHLLAMSSGFEYRATRWFLFNGDDPLTTYHPDQREISLRNTRISGPPGETFRYNKYHPQLLGMILERSTGMSVTEWTQTRLWDRLGMELDGAWTLDSTGSGFEKSEAGLNARAIDFAKLGRLFLEQGRWEGEQLLSAEWVTRASGADPAWRAPSFASDRFYALMWWGVPRPDGSPDFYAAGDHGQYVYVSPESSVIIVRMGVEYGIESRAWTDGFSRAADTLN
jgi:CubicO group peptidase (beta-lactamase class C family)